MTIQDLRIAIAALPDDMEVLVDAYEMGLACPLFAEVTSVFERDDEWQENCAPMLGTHALEKDRQDNDSNPFLAFYIGRP